MSETFRLEDVLMLVTSDSVDDTHDIEEVMPVIQKDPTGIPDVSKVVEVVTTTDKSSAPDIHLLAQAVGIANEETDIHLLDQAVGIANEERFDLSEGKSTSNTDGIPPADDQTISNNGQSASTEVSSRSRKRKRDQTTWSKTQRRDRRQSGISYISARGKQIQKRRVETKKDCVGTCKFKCARKLSEADRQNIFESFWTLTDGEKNHFYNKTVDRIAKKRQRTTVTGESRRTYSYAYFFNVNESRIRVCKEYYLSTLNISQRRVSYYFEVKHDPSSGTPHQGDMRGKMTKDRVLEESKNFVRSYIDSFPRVESYYCRATTKREYLEQGLSLLQMYRLYLEKCEQTGQAPVKENIYRTIFNSEYNLGFHAPKKDRCDRCEEFKVKEQYNMVDEDTSTNHKIHIASKLATKEERDRDRKSDTVVVCFDLENVISCPRANISSFFYRRKLSVYNLTAHCSLDCSAYCAVWNEKQAGRGANEIASSLLTILEKIESEHHPRSLVLWSDSCVSQNRNSGIVFAQLNSHDIFSPLGVMKCMKRSWSRAPMHIIQMKDSNCKRYMESAKLMNLKQVPFTKIKSIKFMKDNLYNLEYKTSFSEPSITISIRPRSSGPRMSSPPRSPSMLEWPSTKTTTSKLVLTKEKVSDIKAMLKFMPPTDKKFMSGLIS